MYAPIAGNKYSTFHKCPFLTHIFFTIGLIGYVQNVTAEQQSQSSSNPCYDVKLQVSEEACMSIRVMHQKGDGSKQQLLVDKMNAQQPIKITNLTVTPSGTIFFNKGATVHDFPSHTMTFKFVHQEPFQTPSIRCLLKTTSGVFNVSGTIKWKGEATLPSEKATTQVRDAILTDTTGSIPLSVWGEHISTIEEGNFYTFTECKLRYFYGKC